MFKNRILEANRHFFKITGYEEKDLELISFRSLFPVTSSTIISELIGKQTQFPLSNEIEMIHADNHIEWYALTSLAMEFQNLPVNLLFFRNITIIKTLEFELQESAEIFQNTIEQSLFGIMIVQNHTVIYANKLLASLLEVDQDRLIGKSMEAVNRFVHPDDLIELRSHIPKDLEPFRHTIFRLITNNGKVRWVRQYSQLIMMSGILAQQITLIDITNQKLAELELQERENEYRNLFEESSDMILKLNLAKEIINVNPVCLKILEYTKKELIGHKIYQFVDLKYHDLIQQKLFAKLHAGLDQTIYGIDMISKSGRQIPVEFNSRMIYREGIPDFIHAIGRDMTERKKEEKERLQKIKNESLEILSAGIAHDFNNILATLLGTISLAKMDMEDNQEVSILMDDAEKAIHRAKELTDQLMTFAKGGTPNKKTLSINPIIKESVEFVMRGSAHRYILDLDDDLYPTKIDEGQISQVLNNLLINAKQAMTQSSGLIEVSGQNIVIDSDNFPNLPKGKYVLIKIKDNGKGIKEEIQGKIFDPYFTTKKTGSGLGLASSFSIIKKHNGTLTFESQEDVGTTFLLYLPISEEPIYQGNKSHKRETSITPGQVIVLDDDVNILNTLSKMLIKLEFTPYCASSGAEILELLEILYRDGEHVQLAILDLTVPGELGALDIIDEIKKIDPKIKSILTSGYSEFMDIQTFKERGFSEFLAKPYTFTDLKLKISDVLRMK